MAIIVRVLYRVILISEVIIHAKKTEKACLKAELYRNTRRDCVLRRMHPRAL